ncbi:hypothetical protein [Campylobacter jejuni]|uniref:hypothetical protein n=1 Tax=Campylobacter jejuni TaxID=197 RepID=UPI00069B5D63|nr:hypothetical protein [Campylobacter jejuni]EHD9160293.1 hypothetical protein [Campylobacter jejuni]OEW29705.1 hypothetical protein AJ878_09295 [Campylobacter jejuni]RTI61937.1 hypothetical protein C3I17_01810 [Campylobacter jejuni]RTJ01061.1 hypothetical protein C3H95_01825 [Campylobacter jejuni]HED5351130.1 hypothetical protein [Campylobacter jejuni]
MDNFFDILHDKEFIFAPKCYMTCNGGCCHNIYAKYFRFNTSNDVVLPMIEAEYLSLIKAGNNNFENYSKVAYNLKNNKKLVVYYVKCSLGGICNPHNLRPLICKLYPYYPKVDFDGNFLGVKPCALFDIFYKNKKNSFCTITHNTEEEFLNLFNKSTKILQREPIMIFIFKTLEYIEEALKKYTYDYYGKEVYLDEMTEDEKYEFFSMQELNSMTLEAYKNNDFINKVQNLYDILEKKYNNRFSKYFVE